MPQRSTHATPQGRRALAQRRSPISCGRSHRPSSREIYATPASTAGTQPNTNTDRHSYMRARRGWGSHDNSPLGFRLRSRVAPQQMCIHELVLPQVRPPDGHPHEKAWHQRAQQHHREDGPSHQDPPRPGGVEVLGLSLSVALPASLLLVAGSGCTALKGNMASGVLVAPQPQKAYRSAAPAAQSRARLGTAEQPVDVRRCTR